MSKKISQLARVIHHLNDRTGDDASSPTGPAGDRSGDLTDLVTVADRYDTEMEQILADAAAKVQGCLLYTSPSPRDLSTSRMPSSA